MTSSSPSDLVVHNVVIYGATDILPEIGDYSDTGYVVNDMYSDVDQQDVSVVRHYAAQSVARYFDVDLQVATQEFEIIVVPFVNMYIDDGRILGRRIKK
ncbi:MAG: hypothetical protein ACK42D_03885 [Candidatus Paceibacteria bacterium]